MIIDPVKEPARPLPIFMEAQRLLQEGDASEKHVVKDLQRHRIAHITDEQKIRGTSKNTSSCSRIRQNYTVKPALI